MAVLVAFIRFSMRLPAEYTEAKEKNLKHMTMTAELTS